MIDAPPSRAHRTATIMPANRGRGRLIGRTKGVIRDFPRSISILTRFSESYLNVGSTENV